MNATYVSVDSPWLGTTVRIKEGLFANRTGPIVRVERRNPDTFNDGCTYWIELSTNFRVGCKWAEFEPIYGAAS